MPLGANVAQLDQRNCIRLLLGAFQSNAVVKAIIFMPGATDEFYLFRRAKAALTNSAPSLLDAVCALTNQTQIRATFHAPFLLLHSDMDPLDLVIRIENQAAAERLKKTPFLSHLLCFDWDWDSLQPLLKRSLDLDVQPWRNSPKSWHFYRPCFAAWNLTGWEALEAAALAGKTRFTLRHRAKVFFSQPQVIFEGDPRFRAIPVLAEPPSRPSS
jgi:hypothetical protein